MTGPGGSDVDRGAPRVPPPRSFTERVRQELGRELPTRACDRRAELAAIAGLAASLHLRGGDGGSTVGLEITTRSGAVARAAFTLAQGELAALAGDRPVVRVHEPGGIRETSSYVVVVEEGARELSTRLGLLDAHGRPRRDPPRELVWRGCDRRAYVRGTLLAGASISRPGRDPHLEITAPTEPLAAHVADLVGEVAAHRLGVSRSGNAWRAVLKSRGAIGRLLEALGTGDAYREWEEHGRRRQLRREATRLANADAANLRRAVTAASAQVRAVERAVRAVGWEGLDPDLRTVALARLANPELTLAELGELCDPPVSKSAVHRRLARLEEIGREGDDRT